MSSLLLGVAGGALVGGRPRRASTGVVAAIAGLALVGVAVHRPVSDAIRRADAKRRTGALKLTLDLPQPISTVFRFCSNFENFPRFVGALREVHDFGDGRSHWVAWTPLGSTIEWDSVTTKYVPNRVIAWKSTPDAPIRTSGTLRFGPTSGGGTCVKVALDYHVEAGGIADMIAAIAIPSRVDALEADIRRVSSQLDLLAAERPVSTSA